MRFNTLQEFWDFKNSLKDSESETTILVCGGPGCLARGSRDIYQALQQEKEKHPEVSLNIELKIKETGCHGLCQKGPLVVIMPEKLFYTEARPQDAKRIIEDTVLKGQIIDELLYRSPDGKVYTTFDEIPFYKHQTRIALRNVGNIDPEDITDYIKKGGYTALALVLKEFSPEQVIQAIEKSGLRGRGGGGFPTGKKWRYCREAEGDTRYIICNGDEGDPGAFMDRSIMEGDPHSVIEGMVIGAYAVGSPQGYIYVREEYPIAVRRLRKAIDDAEKHGFLGDNILGTGFSFNIKIKRGGGAFVCGESTALMKSIEGNIGEPRAKYIHSVERGLYNQPTVLNNVETWCNVPVIITRGWEWFAEIGTDKSKGTKAFSLVGKAVNTGLIEVPMGTPLKKIIYQIGGGIAGKKKFKAVQTGGPSGGCLPEEKLDLPVDYEKLTQAGSMMGSGGLIVMDERTCMVDVARYFLKFLMDESCGKCVPCREGLLQMFQLIDSITKGKGKMEYLDTIETLGWAMKEGCLCGLGKSAPNPVLSTIRYFKEEYLAHIQAKRCPAGVCAELTAFYIDPELCKACGACIKACPAESITTQEDFCVIDDSKCTKCGTCYDVCRFGAVKVK